MRPTAEGLRGRLAIGTVEDDAEAGCSALRREDPWPLQPRWLVAEVMRMAAGKLRDPLAVRILVVAGDSAFGKVQHPDTV